MGGLIRTDVVVENFAINKNDVTEIGILDAKIDCRRTRVDITTMSPEMAKDIQN